jgi:hypothetical protein
MFSPCSFARARRGARTKGTNFGVTSSAQRPGGFRVGVVTDPVCECVVAGNAARAAKATAKRSTRRPVGAAPNIDSRCHRPSPPSAHPSFEGCGSPQPLATGGVRGGREHRQPSCHSRRRRERLRQRRRGRLCRRSRRPESRRQIQARRRTRVVWISQSEVVWRVPSSVVERGYLSLMKRTP